MRRVWKRWGALLLAVVMTLSLLPTAALATGEATNLAQGRTAYASGLDSGSISDAVDGDMSTHWSGSYMKSTGGVATTENAISWYTVDLLSGDDRSGMAVDTIDSITMRFNKLVWPTDCKVQVATDAVSYADYTNPSVGTRTMIKTTDSGFEDSIHSETNWTTIAEFHKDSANEGSETTWIEMSTAYTANVTENSLIKVAPKAGTLNMSAIPEGVRYVRVYFTGINTNAGGTTIGMKELTVNGTLKAAEASSGPAYNDTNIAAGLFDMGVTVSGNATDGWTGTYSVDNVGFTASAGSADTSSEQASKAIDGNAGTQWSTQWSTSIPAENMWYQFALNEATLLSAIRYQQRGGNHAGGVVTGYEIKVCNEDEPTNASNWISVGTGTRESVSGGWTTMKFDYPVYAKYVRLYGTSTTDAGSYANHTMTAAELRLVKADPTATHDRSATVTVTEQNGGAPIAGALVAVGGQSAMTDESGVATVTNLVPNQAYTVTATAENHGDNTAQLAADGTTAAVALQAMERTIAGKVISGGTGLAEAVVTLVQANDSYTNVPATTVQTTTGEDGTYTLNVNTLAAGSYKVRAAKAGYDAVISADSIAVAATELVETHTVADLMLTAIEPQDGKNATYHWDFGTGEGQRPDASALSYDSTQITVDYSGDAMKLTWADSTRNKNLVNINKTNAKDCVIEFDATRGTGGNSRFGLAVRAHGDQTDEAGKTWIYVGQADGERNWGIEVFKTFETSSGVTSDSKGYKYTNKGPAFGDNAVRHFKVVLSGHAITMYVDGIEALSFDFSSDSLTSSANIPIDQLSVAGDVGFLWGNQYGTNHVVTIDNLYVFRNDPTYQVTLPEVTGGTVAAQYEDNGESFTITSGTTDVPAGDIVTVTGTGTGENVLDKITVTKADGSALTEEETTALNITNKSESVWTFAMPKFSVTVTGTFLPKLTGVSIGADAVLKVNGSVPTTVVSGANTVTTGVSYQWYHQDNADAANPTWTACTGDTATAATKVPKADDLNKLVKVVVTGDGVNYASTVSVEAVSTAAIAAADVQTSSVELSRTALTMWKNCETDPDSTDNTVVGRTETLTATVHPTNATNKTVSWSSSAPNVVTVDASGNLIAVANGTATVTASVTSANGTTVSDTVTVTVKTGITSITLTRTDTNEAVTDSSELTIYNNDDANNSVTIVATVNADASVAANTLSWACTHEGDTGHIFQVGSANSATNNEVTITALTGHTVVGTEGVTVTAPEGAWNTATAVRFNVQVKHKLDSSHHVTISGTPKVGQALQANLDGGAVAAEGPAGLVFTWSRTKDGTTTEVQSGTGRTYVPTAADVDGIISLTVTAGADSYYEGTMTATTTAAVAKKDAPAAPTLTSTPANGTDPANPVKGTITIVSPVSGATYEYSANGTDWTTVADPTQAFEVDAPGNYQVRIKETADTKAGASRTVTVGDATKTYHTVSVTATPDEGGTADLSATSVEDGQSVTLTVTPNAGYQIASVTAGGTEVTGTDGADGAKTYTQTVNADLAFVVTFEKLTVKITHSLTNLTCNLTTHDADGNHIVEYGAVHSITLTPAPGYDLPGSIQVTLTSGSDNLVDTSDAVDYDASTGEITFTNGVTRNITITAAGVKKQYTVSFRTQFSGLVLPNPQTIDHGETYTATITANTDYTVPDTISVTMGGRVLTAGTDYTYTPTADKSSATLSIPNVTGNVTIVALGDEKPVEVTGVSITVHHEDPDATGTVPHVGDTLEAQVEPEGAQVDYVWKAGDTVVGENKSTYKTTASDIGKTVSVTVTGKSADNYTGTATASTTAPVENFEKPTEDISIDQGHTATLEFGKTLTLTATVTPDDAADKSVTWTVTSGADVIDVSAAGVVSAKKTGSAVVQAAASGGQTDTCTITVTAAQISVSLTGTVQVGQTLTATVTPAEAPIYSALWYRVGAGENGADVVLDNNGNLTYTVVEADEGYKIKVSVQSSGNYASTATATTASAVVGEHEEPPVTGTFTITITDAANGTVTADKETAAAGETVTLTVTPDAGYALDTLTVTDADGAEVTVENNSFEMPEKNVTVTASFVELVPTGIEIKQGASVNVRPNGTVTLEAKILPEGAVGTVVWTVIEDESAEPAEGEEETGPVITVDENGVVTAGENEGTAKVKATLTLADGTEFSAEITVNVKRMGGSAPTAPTTKPAETTETKENDDGSVTTTVTDPATGTVTETTTMPDGTVTEKVTEADGTVTETTTQTDGVVESVETKPDGTVTETTTQPDGAKVERVTDPDENVAITVTDAEGETVAEVKLPAVVAEPETKFVDVPDEHWAAESINTIAAMGLVEGVGDDKYAKEAAMTRGQLATVLHRLSSTPAGAEVTFEDVLDGKYYTEGVAWAAKVGVVRGFSAEEFKPEVTITREQLALMLMRYAKLLGMDTNAAASELNAFADGKNAHSWAVEGVAWCVKAGILQGKDNGALDPTADVTRAEVAVMLDRFISLMK